MATTISQTWPGAGVTEIHLDNTAPPGIEQGQALPAVRQAAPIPAIHSQTGVAHLECVGVIVGRQHEELAGANDRIAGECKVDSIEPIPTKRHIERSAIVQLDKLVLTTAWRVVHDLGETQRRPGPPGLERVLDQRTPLAIEHRAGANRGVACQLDRLRI